MLTRPPRLLSALVLGVFVVGLCPARADDAETVKEKLFQAKKAFDADVQRFKTAVIDFLDKKEADARKVGNVKAVEQVKLEREAFEKTGESPRSMPIAIRQIGNAARTKLDKAFDDAAKDCQRLKLDDVAAAIRKEQQEFQRLSVPLFGGKTYLAALKPLDFKVAQDWFTTDGTIIPLNRKSVRYKFNGEYATHSICPHPPAKGSSYVKYSLDGKWSVFRATVGVPRPEGEPGVQNPYSALTFEVLGDGKSLWKSEPVTKMEEYQNFSLPIDKVKVLTLLVHCEGKYYFCRAVWFEPILIE